MKNKTAKQIVASYKFKCALVALLYVLALALLIFVISKNMLIGISGIILLGVSVRIPFEKLRETEIESVIYEDLDPEKFSEILELGVLKKSEKHKLLTFNRVC